MFSDSINQNFITSKTPFSQKLPILRSFNQLSAKIGKPAVLIVLSSHQTGWYLPEFAHPYEILSPHYNLTIASPKGGPTTVDPTSNELFKSDAYCTEFLKTKEKLRIETEKLEDFLGKATELSAIFYVSGFGPMFDIAANPTSIKLIREFYDAGKYIATVCHGSVAVVNVVLADGSHLIAGEKVTGYSNVEEKVVDPKDKLEIPFLLEDELNKYSGGLYEKAETAFEEHVVVSQTKKLLTGQNPGSAKGLAGEPLKKILV